MRYMFDFGGNLFEMVMFRGVGESPIFSRSDGAIEDRTGLRRILVRPAGSQNRSEPVQSLRSTSSGRVSAKDSAAGFSRSCRSVRRGLT